MADFNVDCNHTSSNTVFKLIINRAKSIIRSEDVPNIIDVIKCEIMPASEEVFGTKNTNSNF